MSAIYHSLFRWGGGDSKEFIGLQNFHDAMGDTVFIRSFGVMVILVISNLFKLIPSILMAVLIHRLKSDRLQYLYRIGVVLPMIVPGLVTLFIWKFFFDPTQGALGVSGALPASPSRSGCTPSLADARSGSIIGTLAILNFLNTWNDFLMPLIVLRDPELFTIGVGLIYLDGEYVKQWGHIMAAFFVASLPLIVIFLFTMKLFIRGLSAGAVKG